MRAIFFLIVTMIVGLAAWATPARAQDELNQPGPHLRIALVADSEIPKAGEPFHLFINVQPQPGWHGYWLNPGDAGFPPKFDWKLPKSVAVDQIYYPVPDTLKIAGLMNYVYERPYAMLVQLSVPAGLKSGTPLPVRLKLAYLVCTVSVCVPEQQELSTDLVIGNGAANAEFTANSRRWYAALPTDPPQWPGNAEQAGDVIRIEVRPLDIAPQVLDAKYPLSGYYFFPERAGIIDYAAPQKIVRDGDRVLIETRAVKGAKLPIQFFGVLRTAPGMGHQVDIRPAGAIDPPTGGWSRFAATPPSLVESGGWLAILLAFASAVVGGLILNVMPCVFPILSLKALSLAKAGGDERGVRAEALAYTGGAVAICLALGATILALRAGGSAGGWAFQLQDPRVVVLLLLLTVAIALNFAGLFELPVPRFAQASGTSGAFATGALAAFVATPCTGPFMGAALGAALVLPWPAALAVFAGLGLGLALPFLLLGFVPALRRRLPKPGAWMEDLRRILSIPMWLTAVALAWLLGKQAGVDGMGLALLTSLGFAIVLWAVGRKQARGVAVGLVAPVVLVAIAVAAVWLTRPMPKAAATDQSFSEAKLAALRAQGRPVFVYFTADWCLTCKVNERVAIDTEAVQASFRRRNIAVLVGDWTNGDPVLGRFIEAHNRAGVPLYLYYSSRDGAPRVLPQVLTPSMLEEL